MNKKNSKIDYVFYICIALSALGIVIEFGLATIITSTIIGSIGLCIILARIFFKQKKTNYPYAYKYFSKKFGENSPAFIFIKASEWSKINTREYKIQHEFNQYTDISHKYPDGLSFYIKTNFHYTIPEIISDIDIIIQYDKEQKEIKELDILEKKNKEETRIKDDLAKIKQDLKAAKIEKVQEKLQTLKQFIQTTSHSSNNELLRIIHSKEEEISNQYSEGIVDNYGLLKVDYKSNFGIQDSINWRYPVVKYPEYNNIVFPYRRRNIARRGYSESQFQHYLENTIANDEIHIIGDCNILPIDNNRPYEPDIAIICKSQPSIRIDVEIDEPYAAITNQPIHYIGCGDDFRDTILNNIGWIVVRFTEHQVYATPKECTAFIAQIIHHINSNIPLPTNLLTHTTPQLVNRWSEIEAKIIASESIREKYLNHKFGFIENEQITLGDITQTEIERECSKLIKPITIAPMQKTSIGKQVSNNERDSKIQFRAYEHIYLYDGHIQFNAVSNIINSFFVPFDANYWSNIKARQYKMSAGEILEEWDIKGCISKEVGTFMHKQIEGFYNGEEYTPKYKFVYNGKYQQLEEIISLETEKEQFLHFNSQHQFQPFRTEWAIYDEDLEIAGTIDMANINNNGSIDIYDWKRSSRLVDYYGNPKSTNAYGDKSINGLIDIDNTPYWHYCIQQNLYRYILEKNYGIKVNKMYLVNFSIHTNDYAKLEVPKMDKAVISIVNYITALKK